VEKARGGEPKSNEKTNDMAKNMANGPRMPRSFAIRSPDAGYRRPLNCVSDDGEGLSKNHPPMATRLLLSFPETSLVCGSLIVARNSERIDTRHSPDTSINVVAGSPSPASL